MSARADPVTLITKRGLLPAKPAIYLKSLPPEPTLHLYARMDRACRINLNGAYASRSCK